jgi:NAD(P)-dependent dehydrogenase (short-subunit alcohol dehydrogenase family)
MRVRGEKFDRPDPAAMHDAVDATVEKFGPLHYAVNNAGIASTNSDLPDLPVEVWNNTVQVNLSALFYGLKAELPAIAAAGGGAAVNVSSVYADRGLPFRAAYAASKHGVRGLTRSAARDWAARGIRINELQPGVIETPMLHIGPPGEVGHIAAGGVMSDAGPGLTAAGAGPGHLVHCVCSWPRRGGRGPGGRQQAAAGARCPGSAGLDSARPLPSGVGRRRPGRRTRHSAAAPQPAR